ncbi:MAG: acyltransferase [Porphyrobacter sp.]|nr:acyltransferase [Porphyrobacter sp.]
MIQETASMHSAVNYKRVDAIDAMRGLAAIAVVLYHARVEFWAGLSAVWRTYGITIWPDALIGYASAPFSFGWFGVQVFFVLSGYCIHRRASQQFAASDQVAVDWLLFYKRRALRIYPVYLAALMLTFLVSHIEFLRGVEIRDVDRSAYAFFVSVLSLQGIIAPMYSWNGVFWTLSIEIHLYLFYPIVYFISKKFGAYAMLIASAAISTVYVGLDFFFRWTEANPFAFGVTPIFFAFLFMWTFGAYIAECESSRGRLPHGIWWWGLSIICAVTGGIALDGSQWGRSTSVLSCLPLTIAAGAFVILGLRLGQLRRPCVEFCLSSLASIGIFSFSIYATHVVTFHVLKLFGLPIGSHSLAGALTATLASVVFGYTLYLFVERPAITMATRIK